MKLTNPTIRSLTLPPGKRDKTFFDDDLPGFGVRVRESGSKTFAVQYDINGNTCRIPLGSVTALDLGKARSTAKDILARVRLGGDPAGEKAQARSRAVETFGAALPGYLAHKRASLRPASFIAIEHHLRHHARSLHARPLTTIDRRAVAALITNVAHKAGPTGARNFRASMSGFFSWLMREGMIEAHPVAYTNKPTEAGPRERVLTDAELRDVWLGAGQETDFGNVVRLLILTGQRRAEIGGLRWSEIDFEQAVIRVPAARTKNKRPHEVPLSPPALEILHRMHKDFDRDRVFGRGPDGFRGWAVSKNYIDTRIAARGANIAPWRLHDLRRTAATGMAELGIQPHIIETLLNHVGGHKAGVAGTYNRAMYVNEKRTALDRWAEHVLAVIEGREQKIVPLHA